MGGRLLQEWEFRFMGDSPAKPTQELLNALFEVGETIEGIDWDSAFQASPSSAFVGLLIQTLKAWGEQEAGQHLEAAFAQASSPVISADIFIICAGQLARSNDRPLITEASLSSLARILLPQIERAAADGTLANAPSYSIIVRAWAYLGGVGAAKRWIEANMDASADFLSKLTMGFVAHSVGTPDPEYTVHQLPDPELYDLATILAASRKHLAGNELTKDARNRIEVFARVIEHHLKERQAKTADADQGALGAPAELD